MNPIKGSRLQSAVSCYLCAIGLRPILHSHRRPPELGCIPVMEPPDKNSLTGRCHHRAKSSAEQGVEPSKTPIEGGLKENRGVFVQSDTQLAARGQRWKELAAIPARP